MKPTVLERLYRGKAVCLILFTLALLITSCGTGSASNTNSVSGSATVRGTTALSKNIEVTEDTVRSETTGAEKNAAEKGIFVEKEAVSTERARGRVLASCPEVAEDGPLAEDWESYAEDSGVSEEEAARRMRLQECYAVELGNLEQKLRREEGDGFAGLWIAHEPEYRFVVLFTENGQQRIQPYIEDKSYAPLVEVRSGAEATLAELISAQREAGHILDRLDYRADSGVNTMKNRAELYVTDRDEFRTELRKAGLRLPEHVTLIEVEGLSRPSVPE